jgi:hypothetical protein
MSQYLRRFAVGAWSALRATWMIVGVIVAICILGESCYRASGWVRRTARSTPAASAARDPQADSAWYPELMRESSASAEMGWKSFVQFRHLAPFHGQYVNIDTGLRRVTPQAPATSPSVTRVFFFGGSTMWGSFQRDDHTIAAEAARRLQAGAKPGTQVEVTNFGEVGWVSTQELLELMLQLRAGNRPDVVVFYDGINDVASTIQNGVAGIPQNENKRVAEFSMGRALDRGGHGAGLGVDLHALGLLAGAGLRQSEIVQSLQRYARPQGRHMLPADSAARALTRVYVENVRLVESLAKTYGFIPIFVWQPSLHGTSKPLAPNEAHLMRAISANNYQHRLKDVHLAVPPLLSSSMTPILADRFVDASDVFRGEPAPRFIDEIGHNTEAAIPRIVDAFWPALQSAVAQRSTTATPAPTSPSKRQ